ncbi:MAG TPA: hypothetical protein VMT51_01635 [Dongiaceae bacterium]|nr:hypothetical protein [Dongiaceae bacterium]
MHPFAHVRRFAARLALAAGWALLAMASAATPQEPQGEIIGTIDGQAIAVKGPMSVQVIGSEVKTLLRSGVDVRVKSGRAKITLAEGGTIAVCGPAHISMLKSGNALTVALDSGTIHAHIEGNLALNVFTAQILAKTIAIGDTPRDVLVGFDSPGLMCVRSGSGAVHLEEQFGGQSVMIPQGGDVTLSNGQIAGMKSNSGLCACEAYPDTGAGAPEISTLASSEEVKQAQAVAKKNSAPTPSPAPATPPPVVSKAPEPTYQVFMPPLRYDASAKVQDEPDLKLLVLVRRVHARPTLIFESKVEGEPLQVAANPVKAEDSDPQKPAKPAAPAAPPTVVDRVKTFFKSLWPSS